MNIRAFPDVRVFTKDGGQAVDGNHAVRLRACGREVEKSVGDIDGPGKPLDRRPLDTGPKGVFDSGWEAQLPGGLAPGGEGLEFACLGSHRIGYEGDFEVFGLRQKCTQ